MNPRDERLRCLIYFEREVTLAPDPSRARSAVHAIRDAAASVVVARKTYSDHGEGSTGSIDQDCIERERCSPHGNK